MATVNCPKCSNSFDPTNYIVRGGGALAGASAGAAIGSGVGIVAGPIGGMAGTIPGAVIGAALGWLGSSRFARCPGCKRLFKLP